MNRYELSIQIDGAWHALDWGSQEVALTYQVNSLAEFASRNSTYSQSITLPLSPRNLGLLGAYLRMDSDRTNNKALYRFIPCELLVNGIRIAPEGSKMQVISSSENEVEVQIVGPNADLVSQLDATEMKSPAGSELRFTLGADNLSKTSLDGIGLKFVLSGLLSNPKSPGIIYGVDGFGNGVDRYLPALSQKDVVTYLLAQKGYGSEFSSESVIPTDPYVVASSLVPVGTPEGLSSYLIDSESFSSSRKLLSPTQKEAQAYPGGARITGKQIQVQAPTDCTYQLQGSLWGRASVAGTATEISMEVDVLDETLTVINSKIIDLKSQFIGGSMRPEEFDYKLTLVKGEILQVRFYGQITQFPAGTTSTGYASAELKVTIPSNTDTSELSSEPAVGITYDLLASLGFDNAGEFIKEFLNDWAYTMEVRGNTVYFHDFGDFQLQEEQGVFSDWSDKLVKNSRTFSYVPDGWYQENILTQSENSGEGTKDKAFQTKASLLVADTTLEAKSEVFESKFVSLREYIVKNSAYQEPVANIPMYEKEWGTAGSELSYSGTPGPVLVALSRSGIGVFASQGIAGSYSVGATVYPAKVIAASDFLSAYGAFKGLALGNFKKVECKMNLSAVDILELDLWKIVWIEHYGSYFYVTKISNYTPGKLTTVELVKLNI